MRILWILCSLVFPSDLAVQRSKLSADQIINKCLASYDEAQTLKVNFRLKITGLSQSTKSEWKMQMAEPWLSWM